MKKIVLKNKLMKNSNKLNKSFNHFIIKNINDKI